MVLAGLAVVEAAVPPVLALARWTRVIGRETKVPAVPDRRTLVSFTTLEAEPPRQITSVAEAGGTKPMKAAE